MFTNFEFFSQMGKDTFSTIKFNKRVNECAYENLVCIKIAL